MGDNNQHIESDRRLVTVMFADISGFTAMSEKMDPEEVTEVMKDCFSMMETCIEEHGGTIDKFMGDCVMVLFGAPKAQEDAPHRALNTALEIRKRLQKFNEEKHLIIPLNIHIGINTGPVIAGMMGGDKRQDFTVMGDTVNLASRMESAAGTGTILVAENTFRLTEGYFDFEPMGEVKVKGKEQPINAYKVLGPRRTITRIKACQEKGLSPFVGRTVELQLLDRCLGQAHEGHGQVVGLVGEPGVGKSRLICQFRESLPAEKYTVIEGGCIHFGDTIPYLPILDMLKDYFDISEDEKEDGIKHKISDKVDQLTGQLSHVLPPLYEVLSLKVDDEEYIKLDAKQRHDKVFEAIQLILIAESQKIPLIIIIEDLHWMDKTSEEFLTSLINLLATTRILLLLLFRPEYNPIWSNNTFYSQVRVDQLPRHTIEDLVMGILKCSDVEPELIEFIVNRTEGNPLFTEELTFNLLENGAIKKDNNRYTLSLKPADIQVPATIQGIIAARLDRLEGTLKGIMQTASVIGREFAFRILQSLAALKEDLKSSMITLQDLEFIYEKSLFPELEYIFKHALTQEVAYNSLLIKKRKETHERVGQAIEQIYADRLEEFYEMLAYHYSLSDNTQKTFQYLKLSGDKARHNYVNTEAVRFYREALRVQDILNANNEYNQEKLIICLLMINPLHVLGYPDGSIEIFQEAEKLAQGLGDKRSLAEVYSRMGFYHSVRGDLFLGMEYAQKCFDIAEETGVIDLIAPNVDQACMAQYFAGDYRKVVDMTSKTMHLLAQHQREKDLSFGGIDLGFNLYSSLSAWRGSSLAYLGSFEEAKTVLGKGLQNAQEVNDRYEMGWVETAHGFASFWEGDGDATLDHAQNAIRYLAEASAEIIAGPAWSLLGGGYYLCGENEKTQEPIERGIKIQIDLNIPIALPASYWILAMTLLASGDVDKAGRYAEEVMKLSKELHTLAFEGLAWLALGLIKGRMNTHKIDEAGKDIQQGIMILEERTLKAWYSTGYVFLGELFADARRIEEALKYLKKAESLYLEMKVTPKSYWLTRTRVALAKLVSTQ